MSLNWIFGRLTGALPKKAIAAGRTLLAKSPESLATFILRHGVWGGTTKRRTMKPSAVLLCGAALDKTALAK